MKRGTFSVAPVSMVAGFVAPELVWGPGGLSGLVAGLDSVVAADGSEKIVIVGYSWGSWLALQYAGLGARRPDAIVLVNPYLVPARPVSPVVEGLVGSSRITNTWFGRTESSTFGKIDRNRARSRSL